MAKRRKWGAGDDNRLDAEAEVNTETGDALAVDPDAVSSATDSVASAIDGVAEPIPEKRRVIIFKRLAEPIRALAKANAATQRIVAQHPKLVDPRRGFDYENLPDEEKAGYIAACDAFEVCHEAAYRRLLALAQE